MSDDVYVYIIGHATAREVGPVKIGIARDPEKRLKQMQTASPYVMELYGLFPPPKREIAKAIETAFHAVFAQHRLTGEWFDMSEGKARFGLLMAFGTSLSHVGFSQDEVDDILARVGLPE